MTVKLIFASTGRERRAIVLKFKNESDIFKYIEQFNLNIDKYRKSYCNRQVRIIDFQILS